MRKRYLTLIRIAAVVSIVLGAYLTYRSMVMQAELGVLTTDFTSAVLSNPWLLVGVVAGIVSWFLPQHEPDSSGGETTLCPMCKEVILLGARKCKHCGSLIGD